MSRPDPEPRELRTDTPEEQDRGEQDRSLIGQLAHELRNALSPISSMVDLARLRGFDAETSRLLAEKVERALRRTQAILDSFVRVDQGEAKHRDARPPAPGSAGPTGSASAGRAKHILIVEDVLEVRRTYREALVALGFTVTEAADAEQALGALIDRPPDVALIDIHLPGVSGYQLAQAIRARSGTPIYLVMLSGTTLDPATRELAREAGFDECLDKMAGPAALRELLRSAAPR
jgi:CheY-like chemotaxis protein